jgi:ankyrin repeat protein
MLATRADIEAVNADGETPLISAVTKDNVEAAKLLIDKRANLAALNKRGESALMLASKNGWPEGAQIVRMLLDAGADPNLASSSGVTALMSAENFNYRKPWGVSSHSITRDLIASGANVNARSKNGTTALHLAARHYGPDDASFTKELIDAGADVNTADEDGETPLMAAGERGHISKVRQLIATGARVSAKDKKGRTALQYARAPRNDHDDFPHCYDSQNSDGSRENDCEATRQLLKTHIAIKR